MQERPPAKRESLARASLEGNVKIPQNSLGIVAHSVEHCLLQPDPAEAVTELVGPIPFDERLAERTRKANAQHAHYGIPRILSEENVRELEQAGNIETLRFFITTLELTNRIGPVDIRKGDSRGAWASPTLVEAAIAVQNRLTPETVTYLRSLLKALTSVLEAQDVREKMRVRKKLYSGWEKMSLRERSDAEIQSRRLMNELIQSVLEAIHIEGETGPREKQHLAMRLMRAVQRYAL